MILDFKSFMIGSVGFLILFMFVLPKLDSNPLVPDKYSNAENLIRECRADEIDLIDTKAELLEIKETNCYKQNQELRSDLSNYRFLYPYFWVLLTLSSIGIVYFGINKYQTNKIIELKEENRKLKSRRNKNGN